MNKEGIQNISFQIIGFAGDAFTYFFQAVAKAKEGNFEEADSLVTLGEEQLTKAHQAQTELLIAESNGDDLTYSIILVHAQDHLMMTIMYERIAKEFISLYKERK
ncbi:MAG: PTS lactose/cellobiose transporter subunit IIA [Lachnospiraceae bacterium]|nr:PTS lactose/cellobiose transporter subunit IIA [Lachnospiraceae bacterium]